jgi:DNA-binding HxlR family transcriptional regulator
VSESVEQVLPEAVDVAGLRALGSLMVDKWTLPLLGAMVEQPRNFTELLEAISGETNRTTVTRTLRFLKSVELITGGGPTRVGMATSYAMTSDGRDMLDLAQETIGWLADRPRLDERVQSAADPAPASVPSEWLSIWAVHQPFTPRWSTSIVALLVGGPRRFGELEQVLGARYNSIRHTVEHLQRFAVVERLPFPDGVAHVLRKQQLALTDDGREIVVDLGSRSVTWLAAHPRIDRNLRAALQRREPSSRSSRTAE